MIPIRELLAPTHRFDDSRGVFVSSRPQAFAYSDGAAAESYLAEVVRGARDLGVGSVELARSIRDWPSEYHLGRARANLLRPLALPPAGAILEIGAGCGALTRYLGESGATVLAVEGSLERATIAASRCRGLPNVIVVCDNFEQVALPVRFDLVTLVGVLEYSRMFLAGDDPVKAMLERAFACLADDGLLAIAIENQLGLKYLAGAHEDHTDVAYFGVTGQYGPGTAVTFGESELRRRVSEAGYPELQCLYPFPDYKLPSVIVTEQGFADASFNAVDMIATSMRPHPPREGPRAFSESLALGPLVRNGLGAATANSFLLLAGRTPAARARMIDPSVLAFGYSSDRDRCYAKEMRTVATPNGLKVERRPLYPVAAPADAPVRYHLADEVYVQGEVMYRALERIVGRRNWTVDDVASWMRPIADFLEIQAGTTGGSLQPALFDCLPFNLIRRASDEALLPFDLEFELASGAPLDVAHIVFRGLWNCLARVDGVAAPLPGTPRDACSLTLAVMARLGYPVDDRQALEWIRGEHAFSGAVSGLGGDLPAAIPRSHVGRLGEEDRATPPRIASGMGGAYSYQGKSPAIRIQAYFRAADEGYGEDRSVFVVADGDAERIAARLPLPAREKGYARIRLDPMDLPGLVRIDRVAIADAKDEIVWETRRCRWPDFDQVNQLRDLSRLVAPSSGAIWFSEGIDPYFDLAVPPDLLARLDAGGAVMIEMSRLDLGELGAIVKLAELAIAPR